MQLSRQGSRAGKILAAGHRVSRVLRDGREGTSSKDEAAEGADATGADTEVRSGRKNATSVEEVAASDE